MSENAMKKKTGPESAGAKAFLKRFIRKWQDNPLYSTGAVLVVMIIIQTIALGFNYPDFGAWFSSSS